MQTTARDLLRLEYEKRKEKNALLSLRAFALYLRIPPGRLSEILSGKRAMSLQVAIKIAERLELSPLEKSDFFKSVTGLKETSTALYENLAEDIFVSISEWYHFAILSFLELRGASDKPSQIASALGIGIEDVQKALLRLERLGLIKKLRGRYRPTHQNLSTTNDISSIALRKAHKQILEKSKEALDEIDIHERDITNMTMAIDAKKLPEAKKMIRDFRRQLSEYLESGTKTDVYNVAIQLFPLTKRKGRC